MAFLLSCAAGFTLPMRALPTKFAPSMNSIDDAAAKARWLARHDSPWGQSDLSEAVALISNLKGEAKSLIDQGNELNQLVSVLEGEVQFHQQQQQLNSQAAGLSPEDKAQMCLNEGCPLSTVQELVTELKGITAAHRGGGGFMTREQMYIDELLGALNSSLDRAGGATSTTGTKFGAG